MLVLSCKVGQRVVLPSLPMELTVLSIKGKAVRLGIAAPSQIAVHREEMWRALQQEATGTVNER